MLDRHWESKGQVEFPYGYVRLDVLPVSGLTDVFIHHFLAPHAAAVNKSTGTNRSIQQDVLLLLSPPVIVSTSNKLACTHTLI